MPAPKIIPRYTFDDYCGWEGEWELWDGIPIAMTPSPFGPHQRLLAELAYCFVGAIKRAGCRECEVVVELDWVVDPHTVVRPDLSVLCGVELERFIEQPPSLIVEIVSASTSRRDREEKRMLYEQQGVRHYLIADPATNQIERHRLMPSGNYETLATSEPQPTFQLTANCQIQINLPSP